MMTRIRVNGVINMGENNMERNCIENCNKSIVCLAVRI